MVQLITKNLDAKERNLVLQRDRGTNYVKDVTQKIIPRPRRLRMLKIITKKESLLKELELHISMVTGGCVNRAVMHWFRKRYQRQCCQNPGQGIFLDCNLNCETHFIAIFGNLY